MKLTFDFDVVFHLADCLPQLLVVLLAVVMMMFPYLYFLAAPNMPDWSNFRSISLILIEPPSRTVISWRTIILYELQQTFVSPPKKHTAERQTVCWSFRAYDTSSAVHGWRTCPLTGVHSSSGEFCTFCYLLTRRRSRKSATAVELTNVCNQ